ncbi:hypothetical protein [Marinomonas posidonica]|uniref:hypothetical protein n=1 Tax=Marinomonas posidonica TaxID=936476 RepID=UPI0037367107
MSVFKIEIFSPRWKHNDTYTIEMTPEEMTITMQVRAATAVWRENLDPEWQGETLERIMSNDHIPAPAILPQLLEHAWEEWRNGDINDAQLQTELEQLANWLNIVTKNKPDSQFWSNYF